MVNNRTNVNNNSEGAFTTGLSVATRAISRRTHVPSRSSDYIVLSVPVRPNGDDDNIAPEDEDQNPLDSLLQVQQRLEHFVNHIGNQKTRLNQLIANFNQYFANMEANIRSLAQHSVCVEQHIRIILRCLTSWSRYVQSDGHVRDFGRLCAAIANMNNSIDFSCDTENDSG